MIKITELNINYINLKHRKERKKHIETLFNKNVLKGLKLTRFNAIHNKNGAIGCYLSHIALLKQSIQNNQTYHFVIEDDFDCLDINLFESKLKSILLLNKKRELSFDVLLFGGNILPNYKIINNDCAQIFHSQTTVGYCVASHYFETLLNHFREGLVKLMRQPENIKQYAIDKYWIHLQTRHKWLIIFPLQVYQLENDYSDIEKKNVNYKQLMLDSEKEYLHYLSF